MAGRVERALEKGDEARLDVEPTLPLGMSTLPSAPLEMTSSTVELHLPFTHTPDRMGEVGQAVREYLRLRPELTSLHLALEYLESQPNKSRIERVLNGAIDDPTESKLELLTDPILRDLASALGKVVAEARRGGRASFAVRATLMDLDTLEALSRWRAEAGVEPDGATARSRGRRKTLDLMDSPDLPNDPKALLETLRTALEAEAVGHARLISAARNEKMSADIERLRSLIDPATEGLAALYGMSHIEILSRRAASSDGVAARVLTLPLDYLSSRPPGDSLRFGYQGGYLAALAVGAPHRGAEDRVLSDEALDRALFEQSLYVNLCCEAWPTRVGDDARPGRLETRYDNGDVLEHLSAVAALMIDRDALRETLYGAALRYSRSEGARSFFDAFRDEITDRMRFEPNSFLEAVEGLRDGRESPGRWRKLFAPLKGRAEEA